MLNLPAPSQPQDVKPFCNFLLSGIPVISIPVILVICLLQSGLSVYWYTGLGPMGCPLLGMLMSPGIPQATDPGTQAKDPRAQIMDPRN